ncbi:sensor histidine kinase [Methanobacterium spitsbergense]|uniref:PAS domain S-box protein n=1 Tax=Methanobacterium spitsbergense TaxID=2874285 RepID=A0A8T5UVP8_9EURY|nr:histidine kinase dimerization/phosphoacceptor domain -containing protein [Methanobacterium spitsbergense]MBZ2164739.1 PAS domain S-box protein [Methanobacterium spitsbergense]
MNIFSYISLIAFLLCFFLGNFIYHKNSKSQLNLMIALLCILVGFLAFAEFQYRQTTDFQTAYIWLKISGLWPIVPAILLHISLIFTGKTDILKNKFTYLLIYIPAIIISFYAVDSNLMLMGILKEYWGWTYVFPENSLLFDIMSVWTIFCVFLAGSLCLIYYLKNKNIKKLQAKYLLIGLYFPLLITMATDLILPTMSIRIPETTMAMSTVGIGFISYGVWKYRFPALTAAVAADEIVSTMSNFLIMLDHDKNIVTINDATIELLGYDKKDIIGKSVKYLFSDNSLENAGKLFDSNSNSIINFETRLKSKHGEIIPVLLSKSVIKNDDGNTMGIVCIGSNIVEIKHAEDKIKASLEEKDILLRELHHRVKNNLQIILSLINLQSNGIKNQEDLEIFRESQSRVKSLAIIHEKLYQSADFANINFEEYIESLVNYLLSYYSADSIEVIIDVKKDIILNMDTAVPCGLIINELVTNAIKHAFNGNKSGQIYITLQSDNGCFTLIVSDNGKGIPPEVDLDNPQKLGLQLVKSLTDQLEGKIEYNGSKNTKYKIQFRELIYKDRM